jgi:hypothetical protein
MLVFQTERQANQNKAPKHFEYRQGSTKKLQTYYSRTFSAHASQEDAWNSKQTGILEESGGCSASVHGCGGAELVLLESTTSQHNGIVFLWRRGDMN